MDKLKFTKIRDVKSPERAHPTDAGIDFFVPYTCDPITLKPGQSICIAGGVKVKVPKNHALIFFNKSGVASKKSLVLGSCVVDQDYQGELIYNLHNIGKSTQQIMPGDKIVQGLLIPVLYAIPVEIKEGDVLYDNVSTRGDGGFGSSGEK